MAQLKDLIVNGSTKVLNTTYANGGLVLPTQSSAFNDKNISFSAGGCIGANNTGEIGIYGGKIFLRPDSSEEIASGQGLTIQTDSVRPAANNTISLGTSGLKWANVYATTFNGTLNGSINGFAAGKGLSGSENLNNITTPGFYNCGGSNSIVNNPKANSAFGLIVTHNASGSYYTQTLYSCSDNSKYVRYCTNGTWGSWTKEGTTVSIHTGSAAPASSLGADGDLFFLV